MPTGRIADIARLLPPGIKVEVKQIAIAAWVGYGSRETQKTDKCWRVRIHTDMGVFSFDDYRFSEAVKLAIECVCTGGWADMLWHRYKMEHPEKDVIMVEDVCATFVKRVRYEGDTDEGVEITEDWFSNTSNEPIAFPHTSVQVTRDQECSNCGAVVDPIYITCPLCGSYSLYEVQDEKQ